MPSDPYRRVLLKLSGESFSHAGERGIAMEEVLHIANQTVQAAARGTQLAVVIGGGNILRGASFGREQRCSGSNSSLYGHASNRY